MVDQEAMMGYILEEPDIIKNVYENRKDITKDFVAYFLNHPVKRVYLSGHGSPRHVCIILAQMMEKLLKVEVSCEIPTIFNNHSEYNINGLYKKDELLLICPAQSGRTAGPYWSAVKAKEAGVPIICTTLHPDGKLAALCDVVIDKKTGHEDSFPESKGHIAAIAIVTMCVIETAYALKRIDSAAYSAYLKAFERLPSTCSQAIRATEEWYEKNKYKMISQPTLTILGYGPNYGTALEGALKILEATLKTVVGYEFEEYMHGVMEPITRDSVIFFICPADSREQERMHTLIKYTRGICDNCIVISRSDDTYADEHSICCDFTDCEFLDTMEYLIPFQVICHKMARDMGLSTIDSHLDGSCEALGCRV
jgi:glucoselysine-6-phosphate deglycase